MGVSLECGELYPTLQDRVIRQIREALEHRSDPVRDQVLVVVPTRAMRAALLRSYAAENSAGYYGLNLMSINHLAIRIVLDTMESQKTLVSDSIFFPFALYNIAVTHKLEPFRSFRICQALYQSIRDLIDGGLNAELLREALEEAHQDPSISIHLDFQELNALQRIYSRFETFLQEHRILNLQTSASTAFPQAASWARTKRISSVFIYGFYDATQTQSDVMEEVIRGTIENNGRARIFFPFPVHDTTVEHPAQYAQPFFDRMYSLTSRFGGEVFCHEKRVPLASADLDTALFKDEGLKQKERARVDFFSSAGPYDEAWAVAKKILDLVRNHGASFDQILVMTRTLEDPLPLIRVFEENQIPSNLVRGTTLAHDPYARFSSLVLRARQSRLNAATLFEFLSSPFVAKTGYKDIRNVKDLMERLYIRNWDDWDRLKPLLTDQPLPSLLEEEVHENEEKRQAWHSTARSLMSLRQLLSQIPEKASLPTFAKALITALNSLSVENKNEPRESVTVKTTAKKKKKAGQLALQFEETDSVRLQKEHINPVFQPVIDLLQKLSDYALLDSLEITISEFAHVLELYLKQTTIDTDQGQIQGVQIGDIMQTRGLTADYVFLLHLNREIFPRRQFEDPFLPDKTREMLRDLTGAGPSPVSIRFTQNSRLFPLKEGNEEELLLFSIALRSAKQHLFLSYQRADAQGRKQTCCAYLDESLRLLTGKTSEENPAVRVIPKQLEAKLFEKQTLRQEILPTMAECSALADWFAPEEVLLHTHRLPAEFAKQSLHFARRMNSYDLDEAFTVDGCLEKQGDVWRSLLQQRDADHLRLSYSKLKTFMICPFQFFGTAVLGLEESPKEIDNEEQDLDPLTKGILAETVVKEAIKEIKQSAISIPEAVRKAADDLRKKYINVFPPLILNLYIRKFQTGAENLLKYLQAEGYDLKLSLTPGLENKETVELVKRETNEYGFPVIVSGILDLITYKAGGKHGLISDLKWGGSRTANTENMMHSFGELQFCLYPAMHEVSSGEFLPFRYFRLNMFEQFGDPRNTELELQKLNLPFDSMDKALRVFGGKSTSAETYESENQFLKTRNCGIEMLKGKFRILKDPSGPFSECKYCSYTQLCRRTHAATLLRRRMASVEDK
jgi:ATP-dependent helicase/nuclease subunit B